MCFIDPAFLHSGCKEHSNREQTVSRTSYSAEATEIRITIPPGGLGPSPARAGGGHSGSDRLSRSAGGPGVAASHTGMADIMMVEADRAS
jgi:hypothetical protein